MQNISYSPLLRVILAATAGLALSTPGLAQNRDSTAQGTAPDPAGVPTKQLQEVTVVGTVDALQSLDFYAPNSSAVLGREELDALGARKLDQALNYEAGILSEPFGADNKVEWFKIRGFDASISLDGTPTTPNGYFVWKPELFGVESVEILKGPNALIFGASEAGGIVNLVSKRPHKEEALLLNAEVGNRDRLGLGLDYNGLANEDGSVYYRIVAQARREDGMQRRTDMKSYYLAPSVTFDFTDRTSLTLLSSLQHEDGRPTNGFLPAYGTIIDTPYGRIDRRLNAGEPDFDRLKRTQTSAGWLLNHQLSNDWSFTQNYKFSHLNIDQRNVFAFASDGNRELLRGYTFTDGITKNHYLDNRISGKLRLGEGIELRPVVGIDYLKSNTDGMNNGFGAAPNLDMFNPVYGVPFPVSASPYRVNAKQLGVYASAQLRVGSHWNLSGGIRHDRVKGDSNINGLASSYDTSHHSFNLGAIYLGQAGISPYASYSESFKPVNGVDGYGTPYRPYEARQGEVGVKFEPAWLDGDITVAYFDVEEKNALISDASNIQTQAGKRSNHGLELQGTFNLTPATAVKLAYTRNHSRQDITDTQTVRTPLIPKHQASLWLSHRLTLPNSNALTVAAGARYVGSTEDQRYYPGERISSYTLLDLMAHYQINRHWALQLNARNLTDKTYVSGCDFYCYYGGGRTVYMQMQYQWK